MRCKFASFNSGRAARPSGKESLYKIYPESFKDPAHLEAIVKEAQGVVGETLTGEKGAI